MISHGQVVGNNNSYIDQFTQISFKPLPFVCEREEETKKSPFQKWRSDLFVQENFTRPVAKFVRVQSLLQNPRYGTNHIRPPVLGGISSGVQE